MNAVQPNSFFGQYFPTVVRAWGNTTTDKVKFVAFSTFSLLIYPLALFVYDIARLAIRKAQDRTSHESLPRRQRGPVGEQPNYRPIYHRYNRGNEAAASSQGIGHSLKKFITHPKVVQCAVLGVAGFLGYQNFDKIKQVSSLFGQYFPKISQFFSQYMPQIGIAVGALGTLYAVRKTVYYYKSFEVGPQPWRPPGPSAPPAPPQMQHMF